MVVSLIQQGARLLIRGGGLDEYRDFDDASLLIELARAYGAQLSLPRVWAPQEVAARDDALIGIGGRLYDWVDGAEGWLQRLDFAGDFALEVQAESPPNPLGWALLHAPWEILAGPRGLLAADPQRLYAPVRRLGRPGAPETPSDHVLGIAFMVAAPRGQVELDFEAEEAAIMDAAGTGLDLLVEESGEVAQLGLSVNGIAPAMPVLHLSCHGEANWRGLDGREPPRPVLLLETETGEPALTTAAELAEALGGWRPRLAFLSACESAERSEAAETVVDSLATQLLRHAGIPVVLGWEGSVADGAATAFARSFYAALGLRVAPGLAAARARWALLNGDVGAAFGMGAPRDAQSGTRLQGLAAGTAGTLKSDWHLARLWLQGSGGGPLVRPGRLRRRPLLSGTRMDKQILANKPGAEVASPAMFVGRRRQLQAALRALRPGQSSPGMLIHGLGRVGKTSLSGRIADRLGHALAVVHGQYDAIGVLNALEQALASHGPARDMLRAGWAAAIDEPARLEGLLIDLLAGPCREGAAGDRPVLLLIDDLEQVLEADSRGGRHRVLAAVAPVLRAVLRAFALAGETESRLLLTSRFVFQLLDGGVDRAAGLSVLELGEFNERASEKLALRQWAAARQAVPDLADERLSLLTRAMHVARRHPGLQDLLGREVALRPDLEEGDAQALLDAVEAWLVSPTGALPGDARVYGFFDALRLSEPLALAGDGGLALLRAATVFGLPVPRVALAALPGASEAMLTRLCDLGLLVPGEDAVTGQLDALVPSRLASAGLAPLSREEEQRYAYAALPALFRVWGEPEGIERPADPDIALSRLALVAGDGAAAEAALSSGPRAVRGLTARGEPGVAGERGLALIGLLDGLGQTPGLRLLTSTAQALRKAGEGAAAGAIFERALGLIGRGDDVPDHAVESRLLLAQGHYLLKSGALDAAWDVFERISAREKQQGREREHALARRGIADILFDRGDLDEALRIRREEELPVFTRLGEVSQVAITQGKIADILFDRGDWDEAMRIRREEELPVFTRLGEVREVAIIQAKIADILYQRGDLDEAMRIRREEQLPVFTRLRDVRLVAITQGKIADILYRHGDLDEAMRIRREEELPVFTRLGDVREVAITQGQIADILFDRGDLDEALRIRREEQLPVFTRLGEVREVAITQSKIAITLFTIGSLEFSQRQHAAAAPRLSEAWELVRGVGRTDRIGVVGLLHGELLAMTGHPIEACAVLAESAAAFRTLGQDAKAAEAEALAAAVSAAGPG